MSKLQELRQTISNLIKKILTNKSVIISCVKLSAEEIGEEVEIFRKLSDKKNRLIKMLQRISAEA